MTTYRFSAIILICTIIFSVNSFAGDTISLKTALKKKMVAVMIHGTRPGPKAMLSHKYYGQCLQVDVKNLTDSALTLSLETGRILDCDHDSIQNMMITRQLVFTLDGNKSGTYKAYAMCVQETKSSPDAHASYQIGDYADNNLLQFSKIIEKYNLQDNAGQNAVWVFTDNNDTTAIYGNNMAETKLLKKYINKYKYTSANKIVDPSDMMGEPKIVSAKPPTITANMIWEMKKSGNATMQVFDEDNKLVVTVFEKQFFSRGEQTHYVTLSGNKIEKGKTYFIRLKIKGDTKEEMTAVAE